MGDSNFFKGTSTDQDRRFSDKELKLLKTLKFPPEFDQKVSSAYSTKHGLSIANLFPHDFQVDMRKIRLEVLKPWIATRFTEVNGFEDEIVSSMIIGLLEDKDNPTPDPRKIQIQVQGFLHKKTPVFMLELWKLLLDAQSNQHGIPQSMIDEQKAKFTSSGGDTKSRFDQGPPPDRRGEYGPGRGGIGSEGRGRGRGFGDRDNRGRGRGGFRGRGRYDDGPRRRYSPDRRSRSPDRRRRPYTSRSRSPPRRGYGSPRRGYSPGRRGGGRSPGDLVLEMEKEGEVEVNHIRLVGEEAGVQALEDILETRKARIVDLLPIHAQDLGPVQGSGVKDTMDVDVSAAS
ncbi:14805_t:CDS:2 [Acaulospora colombiana]|uniref:14805_t:CDS:1 n=1 Tax=Acaulospora colombiana TaxID=27376 RepID=A0ACA9LFZ3_9GLOM|nr:14805_t:CDS:2 [Acaulospora colombiana]